MATVKAARFRFFIIACTVMIGCSTTGRRATVRTESNSDGQSVASTKKPDSIGGQNSSDAAARSSRPVSKVVAGSNLEFLKDQIEPVGKRLAAHPRCANIPFEFGSLQNPVPRSHHTATGHVYVTTGLLETIKTTDELANILAKEMALVIAEGDGNHNDASSSVRLVGATVDQTGATPIPVAKSPELNEQIARELLEKSGFSPTPASGSQASLSKTNAAY